MRLLRESIRDGVRALLVRLLERRALNYQCVVWFMENNWTCKCKNDEGSVCHDPGLTFLQLYDWVGSNPSIWTWSLENWSREMTPAINICHYTLEGSICLAKGVLLDSIQGKKGHPHGLPYPRTVSDSGAQGIGGWIDQYSNSFSFSFPCLCETFLSSGLCASPPLWGWLHSKWAVEQGPCQGSSYDDGFRMYRRHISWTL